MKKNIILHPFIFALLPLFHLYSLNFHEYPSTVIIKPLIVLTGITIIFLIFFNRIFHNKYKTAVFFSVTILLVFSFGPLCEFFERIDFILLRFRYLIILYLLLFAAILFFLIKAHINFKKVSSVLNLAGLIILFSICVNFINVLYIAWGDLSENPQKNISDFKSLPNNYNLPNIYYIILDSYANKEDIKDVTGFDNEDFITYLEKKGFLITTKNRSNYNFTHLSMAATLNMDYLPMEKIQSDVFKFKKGTIFFKRIKNSQVITYLKSLGYQYVDLSNFNSRYYSIEFSSSLLFMTVLGTPFLRNYIAGLLLKDYVLSTLDSLEKPINVEKPVFVYGHILIPHFPAMFDKNGNTPPFFQSNVQKLYINQLIYTNTRVEKIIDNILSTSKKRPIIIIQGDHGPNFLIKDKEKQMKMRTSILNAAYLPDERESIFYDSMTSANTFRIIFNKYFGTGLKLLPDISYYQDDERGRLFVYSPN
ncbi:MAG: hypothetical protein NTX75_04655 [Proteobacteria bacterium]|nr:hypothetical protein [Pseudomonadota bacterium]